MRFEFAKQGIGRPAWSVENEFINYKSKQYKIVDIKKIMNSPETRYPHFMIFFKNNEMLMLYYSNMHLATEFYKYILDNTNAVTSDTEYRKKCAVCGNIFCYSESDQTSSQYHKKMAAAAANRAVFDTLLVSSLYGCGDRIEEGNHIAQVIDYSKCPKCGSRQLIDIGTEIV